MQDNDYKRKSMIFTAVFTAVLFGLLMIMAFVTPLPLPEEEGIMIDFGDSDIGLGIKEPVKVKKVITKVEEVPVEESNMTQDYEESVTTVPEKKVVKEEKKTEEVKVEEKVEEERQVDPMALYENNAETAEATTSNSEGEAGGLGNQGKETGDPNSNQYTGSGTGSGGVGYSLKGRKAKGLPKPIYNSNEQGIVKVKIIVDREGKVISAQPGVKGSTTFDSALLRAAQQAALNTRFDKKDSAPSKQSGVITYHFVLK